MMPPTLPLLTPLTAEDLQILRARPYETPRAAGPREARAAERLLERGLLETSPAERIYRCTPEGEAVAAPLTMMQAQRALMLVRELEEDDPEAAASAERALWSRFLLEVVLAEDAPPRGRGAPSRTRLPNVSLRDLPRIAELVLRTREAP